MNILYVTSEAVPFCKTGGLADVAGSLPQSLAANGDRVSVILPLYQSVADAWRDRLHFERYTYVRLAWRSLYCGLFSYERQGVTWYFVDNEQYFKRPELYGYYDDGERFAFFCRAVTELLPLLPDVVYLAVNVRGCTAHVQVVERVRPPHLYRDSDVQNIVAARDGLITKIEALDGVTCAAVGETVQAGQVLLSGVADSPRGCRYMRATGRIWARTWYEWTVPVPLETVLKDGTEPVKTRTHTALDLGRHRIALPAGDSILQGRENCDKIIQYRGVQLPFGLRLPVTLVTETVAERAVYDGERPEDEARAEGQKQLEAQLAQTIGDDGRVLKADVSARRQGAYLMVTLRAECEEQIGVDAPLTITSDTGR